MTTLIPPVAAARERTWPAGMVHISRSTTLRPPRLLIDATPSGKSHGPSLGWCLELRLAGSKTVDLQRLQLHIQRDTATRAATSLGLGIRESIAWVSRALAAATRPRRNTRGRSRNPFKNQDGDGPLLRLPAQRGGEFEICLRRFGVSLIRYTPSSSVHRLTVAWQDSKKEAGASSNANSRHGHEGSRA